MAASEPLGRCRPRKLQLRALGEDDVELRVAFCGVSRADLHALARPDGSFPLAPGQEVVGVVTRVGSAVKRLAVGDRVGVGSQVGACLNRGPAFCPECAVGSEAYCRRAEFAYDPPRADGSSALAGFAEFVRVSSHFAFKVPDNIPTSVAAPLFSAGLAVYTALAHEKVSPGDRVGVVGIGGLGHLALQFALAMGATPVAFSSTSTKQADALQLGADEFYCTRRQEDLTKAAGSIDLLVVTTGAPDGRQGQDATPSQAELLALLRPFGSLVTVAEPGAAGSRKPPVSVVTAQGLRVTRSRVGSVGDMQRMLALVGEVNLRPAVVKIPMSQLDEGLGMLRQGKVRYRLVAESDLGDAQWLKQPRLDSNPAEE
jgi:alcohol dehydrogenase (NADP+)